MEETVIVKSYDGYLVRVSLNKKDEYLLVCEYGIKSKKTSQILSRQGYQTYNLIGGMRRIN